MTRDQVAARGEKIGASIDVEAEEGLAAVLVVVVTKISCICEYVLDTFTPLCVVFSQTINGLFGDLFGGLLFNTIIVISVYVYMQQYHQLVLIQRIRWVL